jgi:DNA-binding NtrC family response regulator
VLPLARAFARQAAAVQDHPFRGIDLQAARLLVGYAWPGNVRELRHAIARAVALADGPVLHPTLLPPELTGGSNAAVGGMLMGLEGNWREARQRFDRIYFARLLERCGGNLTEAARLAGLARSNLYRKLEELRLH